MTRKFLASLLATIMFVPVLAQPSQFRGADRNGVYPESGLLDEWPDAGPRLIATIPEIGDGFAAPAITDQGIFVAGMKESTGYMHHFNHRQELQWSVPYGKEFTFKYTGARSTPTLEGDRLYYSGTFGDAFCMDVKDGSFIWKKNIFQEFGGNEIKWGYTESPLIYEDLVILTPGGPGHNVVALDKLTGNLRWSASADSTINAYCSPMLINHNNQDYILLNTRDYLLIIYAKTGEIAYRHPIYESHTMHAVTPLYADGKIFYSSGYGEGSVLFAMNKAEKRLDTIYVNPDLDCKLSGLIMVDGTVFGTSDRKKQWVGVDFSSGETVFTSRDLKPGSFLLAENKFFIFTETGEVALAAPGPRGFSVISRFKSPAHPARYAFAHPVLFNGVLYIRYRGTLWLYDVSATY